MPADRDQDRDATRAADQLGIERLIDALVPALVTKLGTLNVGELEVHEGDWRVRLRRPAGSGAQYGRRESDRPATRGAPGHDSVGSKAPASASGRPASAAGHAPDPSSNGSSPLLSPVGPGRPGQGQPDGASGPPAPGPVAASPAVGVFQPGAGAVIGTRVRAGDRLGTVDMLGIPQEVLAPADGIVVSVIAEAGTAVEYGQPLIQIEPASAAEAR